MHAPPRALISRYDLSMIASLRKAKITRAQAIMAFQELCRTGLSCVQRTGLSLYALLGSLDDLLGLDYAIQTW